jgi:hypothetical protein
VPARNVRRLISGVARRLSAVVDYAGSGAIGAGPSYEPSLQAGRSIAERRWQPVANPATRHVVTFFQGSGIGVEITGEVMHRFPEKPDSINKHEMPRLVITGLNERGERTLRERRESCGELLDSKTFLHVGLTIS